jgi:hypothetical protein
MRARVVTALLGLALLSSCTSGAPAVEPPASPSSPAATETVSRTNGQVAEAQLHEMAQRILHRRERAVQRDDVKAYLADVDPDNSALVSRERRRFANLVQLPLSTYQLDAVDATWPSGFADDRFQDTAYIPYVEEALQLRGFDAAPVVQTTGVTFARLDGRWRIVSDDDVADREADGSRNLPWDLTRIVVRRSAHALGIFDARSAPAADRLMAWTEESIAAVRTRVPERWPGTVVFYALSSHRLLRTMGTRFLDRAAVAFPVLDDVERPTRRVATRVVINPTYLPREEPQGTYLLTHEITHVALARTNGSTPAWVQEGLADYVATGGGDRTRWQPSPATAARAGRGADAMPGSTFFGDDDPGFEYDLSLGAFVYLAGRFGEDRLWAFLDRLVARARVDGDAEGHVDPVLRSMFGLDSAGLASRAARLVAGRGM